VTTLRLKEKTAEFLRSYTPLVFDAIKEYVTRQQQMLQECSAAFAGLTDNKLGGMRAVRAKRVDIEVRLLHLPRPRLLASSAHWSAQTEEIQAKISEQVADIEREE